MASSTIRVALFVILLTMAFARPGAAQTVVDSFPQLTEVVKVGTIVYVQDEKGERTKGKIRELSPASLTLVTSEAIGREVSFPAERVTRISRVDSRLNGFLIGFAAGAVPGGLLGYGFTIYCENESAHCPAAPAIVGGTFGLIGGWIGFTIDGAINGQTLVFRRAGGQAAKMRVMPLVGARTTGVGVSFKF